VTDRADHAARLDAIVAEYFEVKATAIIDRAVRLLDHGQVRDDDAVDALGDDLLAALERRYGRMDGGWRDATERLVRTELDRQVQQRRRGQVMR